MSEIDYAALEALEKAATPGPWYVSPDDGYTVRRDAGKCRSVAAVSAVTDEIGVRDQKTDAAFIAAIRNAAPALITAAKERDEFKEIHLTFRDDLVTAHAEIANLRGLLREANEAIADNDWPAGDLSALRAKFREALK